MGMRKELEGLIEKDRGSVNAYQNLEAQAGGGGISDAALIIGYMKTLDPTSVVRESEFATIQNATGIDERLRSYIKRKVAGDKLSPEQRADILQSAKAFSNAANQRITERTRQYAEMADEYGYDPVRATGSKQGGKKFRDQYDKAGDLLKEARNAVMKGADKEAVRQRLIEKGYPNIAKVL